MNHTSRWLRLRAAAVALGLAASLLLLMMVFVASAGQAAPNEPAVGARDEVRLPAAPVGPRALAAPLGIQTIGNYVWSDPNANGIYNTLADAGEEEFVGGIDGVLLKLYVDGSDGSARDNILQLSEYMSSTLTGALPGDPGTSGWYEFEVTTYVTTTRYWVEVAPSNFDPGGKLAEAELTSGSTFGPLIQWRDISYDVPGTTDNVDYGFVWNTGAIGDYVWYDADADALQDVGEPGIGNVTIRLVEDTNGNGSLDPVDAVVATTVTDANGGYIFPDLPAGTYFVDVTDAGGVLTGYTHTVGAESQADPYKVVLATGQVVHNADFGYYQPPGTDKAVVGDTVWWDTNENGTRDPGEAGISGVTVELRDAATNALVDTTTTDQNGNYLFSNVDPGTYYVDVTTPPLNSVPSAGAPDPTAVFPVSAGQQYLDADIGFVPTQQPATIGGTVWNDTANPNGILTGEPGLPGVTVDLLDSNGNVVATTTTDTNGNYSFVVPAGSYQVQVSDTHNVLDDYTGSPLGDQGLDSTNKLQPWPVTVAAGVSDTKGDFGYYQNVTTPAGIIGNQVWVETDHDGLYEPQNGEVGVAGVVVRLTPPAGVDLGAGPGQPITTMTGADGGYAFTSLPAGAYGVQVIDTFGILTGYQVTALGTAGVDNNNQAQPYGVNLPSASSVIMTADFGYWIPGGVIGDYVWYDADADALQDVGEPGIGNVTLRLVEDTNSNGSLDAADAVVATTMTDANGGYIFPDLPAGTYFVDVTDAGGVLTGYTHTVGAESQADPYKVVLATGQVVHNADFGYNQPPGTDKAVVGDTVWWDTNENGTRDPGEAGIPGVTVELRDATTNALVDTTTTDQNGNYLFSNVDPGTYYVDVTTPPLNSTPSPAAPDPTVPFTVLANEQYLNADIGYVPTQQPATFGGTVWNDTTSPNGILTGEPGIPGVTVNLLDSNGNIIATTTTDANGNYTFTVPAGSYQVQVSDTHNVLDDYTPTVIGDQTQDNTNKIQPFPITLVPGPNTPIGDFGYVQNVTTPAGIIGNQVWYETDHDGLYEPQNGELGVAGVVVRLTPPAGVDLGAGLGQPITTMTGADGGYAFTSLPAGLYSVQVIDTFGILTGYQVTALGTAGADNNNQAQPYAVNLPSASSVNMTADLGYYRPLDFALAKTINTLGDIRVGDTISFTIRITNTGTSPITVLPLSDQFDPLYLTYVGAYPTPNAAPASGPITWNDLTGSVPNGFGTELAPTLGFSVVITFTARADTTLAPGSQTVNYAIVSGAKTDPDGSGPLPQQTLPTKQDDAPVQVFVSTGVEIVSFAGTQDGSAARLAWETASEAGIAGFNVLQLASDGQSAVVNGELIFAEHAGAGSGARYELLVPDLAPGDYSFMLEVIRLDGTAQRLEPVVVSIAP